ncbi:hypothetical protein [Pseudonocardia zijingensis]|uniref:Uncharacterized protein n=1 Tax=Pseudonocardia zijingensis TaxID=153376 RepID=A0ABN1N8S0_9PSEU
MASPRSWRRSKGFVAATRRNGFTEEQARAIVAYMFGWHPADGSKPEDAA